MAALLAGGCVFSPGGELGVDHDREVRLSLELIQRMIVRDEVVTKN